MITILQYKFIMWDFWSITTSSVRRPIFQTPLLKWHLCLIVLISNDVTYLCCTNEKLLPISNTLFHVTFCCITDQKRKADFRTFELITEIHSLQTTIKVACITDIHISRFGAYQVNDWICGQIVHQIIKKTDSFETVYIYRPQKSVCGIAQKIVPASSFMRNQNPK